MKTFKKIVLTAAAVALGTTASAKDVVMAYSGSLKDPAMQCGIQRVTNELAELLGGEAEMHVGGTGFASPKNLYTQLERGVTDISIMPLAYTPGRFPLSEVIGLPFAANDNINATIAANSLLEEHLSDEFAGTHPLAILALPHYQIHLKDEVEDITTGLNGKRVRVTGAVLSDTLRGLGADIVGVPIFQVYENMQKGVFEGFVLPNVPLAAFKLHEVSDYHIQADIAVPVLYMGLSKKFYDGLSAEQQAMVDEKYSGVDAAVSYVNCFERGDAGALGLALKNDGGAKRALTDEERAAVQAIATPMTEAYLTKIDGDGLGGTAFYEAFQDHVQKLDATN